MEARISASLAKLASAPAERQRAALKRERLAARREQKATPTIMLLPVKMAVPEPSAWVWLSAGK
jgi:hypothetical protein